MPLVLLGYLLIFVVADAQQEGFSMLLIVLFHIDMLVFELVSINYDFLSFNSLCPLLLFVMVFEPAVTNGSKLRLKQQSSNTQYEENDLV